MHVGAVTGCVPWELKVVSSAEKWEIWLLCVMQQQPAVLATCLDCEANVAVAFNRRSGMMDECYMSVTNCVHESDAM